MQLPPFFCCFLRQCATGSVERGCDKNRGMLRLQAKSRLASAQRCNCIMLAINAEWRGRGRGRGRPWTRPGITFLHDGFYILRVTQINRQHKDLTGQAGLTWREEKALGFLMNTEARGGDFNVDRGHFGALAFRAPVSCPVYYRS